MAAARLGDTTAHGGTIGPVTTGVAAQVFIGGKPAACLGDPHVCPMFSGPKPHTGGTITKGSSTVLIGGKPAARISDLTVCTSEPGQIALGEMTVLIGDKGGSGGGGGAGGPGGSAADSAAEPTQDEATQAQESPAAAEAASRAPGDPVQIVGSGTHWVSIELVDEMEQPVVGEPYRVRLPDGREASGALDGRGQAKITGLKNPGACEVTFPELDLAAWYRWTGPRSALPAPPDAGAAPGTRGVDAPVPAGAPVRAGKWRAVRHGECVSSIAADVGHFWQTIWDHGANAELRRVRGNPNVLRAEDAVFVPDRRPKGEAIATDKHHRFVRRGEPAQIRLRMLEDDEPRAGTPWVLEVDGRRFEGITDADGQIVIPMTGNARRALLRVGPAGQADEYELALGTVEPIDTQAGVRTRLENLGFLRSVGGESEKALQEALRVFQGRSGLPVTGELDEATRARLLEAHGS
jgi:uncharacterized Zn-binding protein involved in type VI secretion